jgi:hypothetical protein
MEIVKALLRGNDLKPGKLIVACTAIAVLAGCATLNSKTPVNSTGTTGDCGYKKTNKCEVMISYDRLRGFTFTPEDLTVHFNPANPEPQPITWTFKPVDSDVQGKLAFTTTTGILFYHLDPDGGPFHSARLGSGTEHTAQLRTLSFTVTDTCGLACKAVDAPDQLYIYGVVLYDDAGNIVKTADPAVHNSER